MLDDVAPPIKAAMYSRNIDPATPGLISNLLAQVVILTCFSFEYSTTLLLARYRVTNQTNYYILSNFNDLPAVRTQNAKHNNQY